MADWRLNVTTAFVGSGIEGNPYRAQIGDDYALAWQDETGTDAAALIPATNAYIVEVVCSAAIKDLIEADSNYVVNWSEEVANVP